MPANKNTTKKKKPVNKRRRMILWISAGAVLTIACFAAAPAYESFVLKAGAKLLPDVAKIYELESQRFPDRTVSVLRNTTFTNGTQLTSYHVTLQSLTPLTAGEYATAGRIACSTGLADGTYVTITSRKQFLFFNFAQSDTRQCAAGDWVEQTHKYVL